MTSTWRAKGRTATVAALLWTLSAIPVVRAEVVSRDAGVLCLWGTLLGFQRLAEQCFPNSHQEIRTRMSEALVKFDRFIIANAPVSEAMLAAEKQAFLQKRQDEFEAMTPNDRKANCDKNPYTQVFNDPPRRDLFLKILASTDEFLAVPRKPTMNPCF